MATSSIFFGIKIILQDHDNPISENTSIGLYNCNSALTANANSGQKNVTVAAGTTFEINEVVTIKDDNASETNIIASKVGNVLTMRNNLQNTYTTTDNGIVHANSKFRWCQNPRSSFQDWNTDMLVQNGIAPWTKQIDLSRGGNISQGGSGKITVKNTSQLWNTLETNSIYFNRLKAEIWEIEGQETQALGTLMIYTRRWVGMCESPSWDSKQYTIPLRNFFSQRNVNFGTQINQTDYPNANNDLVGNDIPITIGEIKTILSDDVVVYNGYAKAVRTGNKETQFVMTDEYQTMNAATVLKAKLDTPSGPIDTFPVLNDTHYEPHIKIGTSVLWTLDGVPISSGSYPVTALNGQIINMLMGSAEGDFRKIESVVLDFGTDAFGGTLELVVDDYYSEELSGNSTATDVDNSWCEISDIKRIYHLDTWPCKDFIDKDGNVLSEFPELYEYTDNPKIETTVSGSAETIKERVLTKPYDFLKISNHSFEIEDVSNKNTFEIDVKHLTKSKDTLNSYILLTSTNVELLGANAFDLDDEWEFPGYQTEGVGYVTSGEGATYDLALQSGSLSNTIDKDFDSLVEYRITANITTTTKALLAFKITPPIITTDFDSVYMGIHHYNDVSSANYEYKLDLFVKSRHWMGLAKQVFTNEIQSMGTGSSTVYDIPDFYFETNRPSLRNAWFFHEEDSNGLLSGYKLFELSDINTKEKFNNMQEIGLFLEYTNTVAADAEHLDATIRDVCFIFVRRATIENEIYTPMKGRIYNDTWGGRVTSTDMIEAPHRVFEHFTRLQNFGDSSFPPSAGWGQDYANGALIQTSGEGGIDESVDSNYSTIMGYNMAFQILDYSKKTTNWVKKIICQNYFLANWVNSDGYECLKSIRYDENVTPSELVTLADIVDRNKLQVIEPSPLDIYPEPYIQYRKNNANGKFEGLIKVTHADADTYDSSYVIGMTGAAAETLWNNCHTLWTKCKSINPPPQELTELLGANGDDADTQAQAYISNWVSWQFNKKCVINVHYSKAKTWEEAYKFHLQLPHQTNNLIWECVITKITKDPNPPYVITIEAVMIHESVVEEYIKDNYTAYGNNNDWKDTYTVYGNDQDKKDNM